MSFRLSEMKNMRRIYVLYEEVEDPLDEEAYRRRTRPPPSPARPSASSRKKRLGNTASTAPATSSSRHGKG
jgi:hypothetical protein